MNLRKTFTTIALISTVGIFASGCESTKNMWGALVGAGAGAAIGSQIGGGTGQLLSVAVGTLAGAWIGNAVVDKLSYPDRARAEETAQTALEYNEAGAASSWKNTRAETAGTVKPIRDFETVDKQTKIKMKCREFEQTVTIDGEHVKTVGVACRKPDGWRIVHASNDKR